MHIENPTWLVHSKHVLLASRRNGTSVLSQAVSGHIPPPSLTACAIEKCSVVDWIMGKMVPYYMVWKCCYEHGQCYFLCISKMMYGIMLCKQGLLVQRKRRLSSHQWTKAYNRSILNSANTILFHCPLFKAPEPAHSTRPCRSFRVHNQHKEAATYRPFDSRSRHRQSHQY